MRTIQSEFKRHGITKQKQSAPVPVVKPPKSKEQLSKWEIEELMGYRREKFKRVRGSVRRK